MFSPPSVYEKDDLVAYVGAGLTKSRFHTSLVRLSISTVNQMGSYLLETPLSSVLAELVTLGDGLSALLPLIAILRPQRVLFYTDSMQAVRAICRVDCAFSVATDFHRFVDECPCPALSAGLAFLAFPPMPRQTLHVILKR